MQSEDKSRPTHKPSSADPDAGAAPLPPELSPLTDPTHGDMDDPAIQSGLDRMRRTIAKEKEELQQLDKQIEEAKDAGDHLYEE